MEDKEIDRTRERWFDKLIFRFRSRLRDVLVWIENEKATLARSCS